MKLIATTCLSIAFLLAGGSAMAQDHYGGHNRYGGHNAWRGGGHGQWNAPVYAPPVQHAPVYAPRPYPMPGHGHGGNVPQAVPVQVQPQYGRRGHGH